MLLSTYIPGNQVLPAPTSRKGHGMLAMITTNAIRYSQNDFLNFFWSVTSAFLVVA